MTNQIQSENVDDQPMQESITSTTDQVDGTKVDPVVDQSGDNIPIEINGKTVTLEELKQGYMRQSDYTQKTQAIADERRELTRTSSEKELDPEVAKAVSVLKDAGMATKEDLQDFQVKQEEEKALNKFFKQNPDLQKHEKAIRAIGKTDNTAWEDIAVNYGFSSKDKLTAAKENRAIIGSSVPQNTQTKHIKDLSEAEWEQWKKTNIDQGSGFSIK